MPGSDATGTLTPAALRPNYGPDDVPDVRPRSLDELVASRTGISTGPGIAGW